MYIRLAIITHVPNHVNLLALPTRARRVGNVGVVPVNGIKHALIHATGLRHPNLNVEVNLPFHLYTDASDYSYGAVLMQEHASVLTPVAWIGRKMTSSEVHHATLKRSSMPSSLQHANGGAT